MKLNPDFKLITVAGEHIILDSSQGSVNMNRVFSMNDPAAWLWRKIEGTEFDEAMLVELICDEYDVDRSVAESDVHSQICLWKQFKMLL